MVRAIGTLCRLAACVAALAAGISIPQPAAAQVTATLAASGAPSCPQRPRFELTSVPLGLLGSQLALEITFDAPLTLSGSNGSRTCTLSFSLDPAPSPLTFEALGFVAAVASSNPTLQGSLQVSVRLLNSITGEAAEDSAQVGLIPSGGVQIPIALGTPLLDTIADPSTPYAIQVTLENSMASPEAQLSLGGLLLNASVRQP
jgi:hypothetical protein